MIVSFDEPILFEAEDETRFYEWQFGRAELDPAAGTITIRGHARQDLAITIPISEVAKCEIVEREDISTLGPRLFSWVIYDETGAVGCPLAFFLWPIAIVDAILARKARFPVIKLTQAATDGANQGWVTHLRSRKRRRRGRAETFEMAQRVIAFLRQRGYNGPVFDLTSQGGRNQRHGSMIDTDQEHDN